LSQGLTSAAGPQLLTNETSQNPDCLDVTIIASHAFPRRQALSIAALAELTGPFVFGVVVATTWGSNVLAESRVELSIILAALVAAGRNGSERLIGACPHWGQADREQLFTRR